MNHLIEISFTPMDMIACIGHAYKNKGVDLKLIVSENAPHKKIKTITYWFNLLQKSYPESYKSVTIIQGYSTPEEWYLKSKNDDSVKEDSPEQIKLNVEELYKTADVTYKMVPSDPKAYNLSSQSKDRSEMFFQFRPREDTFSYVNYAIFIWRDFHIDKLPFYKPTLDKLKEVFPYRTLPITTQALTLTPNVHDAWEEVTKARKKQMLAEWHKKEYFENVQVTSAYVNYETESDDEDEEKGTKRVKSESEKKYQKDINIDVNVNGCIIHLDETLNSDGQSVMGQTVYHDCNSKKNCLFNKIEDKIVSVIFEDHEDLEALF